MLCPSVPFRHPVFPYGYYIYTSIGVLLLVSLLLIITMSVDNGSTHAASSIQSSTDDPGNSQELDHSTTSSDGGRDAWMMVAGTYVILLTRMLPDFNSFHPTAGG